MNSGFLEKRLTLQHVSTYLPIINLVSRPLGKRVNYMMPETPSSSDSRAALQGSEINFPTRAIHVFSVLDSNVYCGKLIIWLLYTNR